MANSVWYFGGPVGTLLAAAIITHFSFGVALALVILAYALCIAYVVLFIKESHGPFATYPGIANEASIKVRRGDLILYFDASNSRFQLNHILVLITSTILH